MENGCFVEEAESRQVVFTFQEIRVARRWEVRGRRHGEIHLLSVGMEVRSLGRRFVIFYYYYFLRSPFHQRAAAGAAYPQDCSPEGSRLTPTPHLGQAPTHSTPGDGAEHDIRNPEKPSGAERVAQYFRFWFKTFLVHEALPGLSQMRYFSPISIKGS